MKRTLLLMWLTMATVCASAQYKSVITVSEDEMDEPHRASYNLTSVCKSLGYGRDNLGHILEVWLDPNRTWRWKDEYRQYENLPLMYLLSGGEKTLGQPHQAFGLMADGSPWTETDEIPPRMEDVSVLIEADPGQNQLNFSLYLMPDPVTGQTALKAGDVFHATFGLEYEGREATFDLTLNIVKGTGGNDVSLRELEKVGEETVKLKYKEGKPCKAVLDLASIASHFGGDVEAGNLQLYVARKGEPGVLSDRCAYSETPTITCDEEMAENPDYEALRNVFVSYYPLPQEIHVKPTGGFAAGEHATGPLYLVADDKYYELQIDAQFGDSEEEAKNMAVAEKAEQCGTFARRFTLSPSGSYVTMGDTIATASFSLAVLAKALGTDDKSLASALKAWMEYKERPDGTEMIYNLSDHASTTYNGWPCGSYAMKKNGRVSRQDNETDWYCQLNVDDMLGELQYNLYQTPGALQDGDVCNAKLGLYYEGRMVTLDLTMNIRNGELGETVALREMKKVGEQLIAGQLNYTTGIRHKLNLTEIASHFSSGVAGKSLKLYVMADPERQMLTDRYAYETTPTAALDIECTTQEDFRTLDYFYVSYSPYPETLTISAPADAFTGGQHSSGSVFLTDGNEYYELVLDIQFGHENDECDGFNIVKTDHLDVQLMTTDGFYTYINAENADSALISTPIDMTDVAALLGTETPVLYAEQMDGEGSITLSSRYNCAPGQGFWFTAKGGQAYRATADDMGRIGVYLANGSLRWYEMPYPRIQVGETYRMNLYLANPEQGTAVMFEINIKFVDKIETANVAYVHRLPQGLAGLGTANSIHNVESIMRSEPDAVYDLQGRKLNAVPAKGLYIKNGRKYNAQGRL